MSGMLDWLNDEYIAPEMEQAYEGSESDEDHGIEISVVEEINMVFIKELATSGAVFDHGVMTYISQGVTEEMWETVCQHNIWLVQAGLVPPMSENLIDKVIAALVIFKDQNRATRRYYCEKNHAAQIKDGYFWGAVQSILNTYSAEQLRQLGESIVIHNSPQVHAIANDLELDNRLEGSLTAVKTIYKTSSNGLKNTEIDAISITDALNNVADLAVGPGWAVHNVATVTNKSYKWMVSGGTSFYNLLKTINMEMIEMYGYWTIPLVEVNWPEFKKLRDDRRVFDSMFEVLHSDGCVVPSSVEQDEAVRARFPYYGDAYKALRNSGKTFSFADLVSSTDSCAWMGQESTLLASYAAPIICCQRKEGFQFLMFASTKKKLWPDLARIESTIDHEKEVYGYVFHEDIAAKVSEYSQMLERSLLDRKLCVTDQVFHPWVETVETQYTVLRSIVSKKVENPNMCVIRRSNIGAIAPVMDKLNLWDAISIDPMSNNVYLMPAKINTALPNRFISPVNGKTGYVSPIGIRLRAGIHGNYNPGLHVARVIEGVKEACEYMEIDSADYITKIKDNIPRIVGTGKTVIMHQVVNSICDAGLDIRNRLGTHYVMRAIGGKANALAVSKVQELLFSADGVNVPVGSADSFNPFSM